MIMYLSHFIILKLISCLHPGSSTPISNEDLQAVTNDISDTSNRTITFSVIRHPKLGRLVTMQPDNSTKDISTFTQDMVSEEILATLLSNFTIEYFNIQEEG